MTENFKIDYLSNQPEFIPALTQAVHREWSHILRNEKIEDRLAKITTHLNQDTLPVAWVAYSEGRVLGTAALRICDLEGFENLTPWLGGVFVIPRERGKGVGRSLCRVVEEKAFQMGFKRLYLMTLDKVDWYRLQGWTVREQITWHGYPGFVMEKGIG